MEVEKSPETENLGPSFILFLIWTFTVIARPQDYLSFLMPIRPVLLICMITVIVMFFERVWPRPGMFRLPEVGLVLVLYLVMVAEIPFAAHRGVAFRFLLIIMPSTILYFLVAIIQLRSMRRLKMLAAVIGISVLFSACFYLDEVVTYRGFRAAAGETYDPNDIALVFTTFIPLCLYVLLADYGWKIKVLSAIAAFAATAGVMLSRSRGGVLALAVIIVVFLLSSVPRIRGIAKVATVIVLAFVFLNYFSAVEGRFENMGQDYNFSDENGRFNIWEQNLAIIAENPVLGTGAGCSPIALGQFRALHGGTQAWQASHSSLFQLGVEAGIPGFILFAIANVLAIVNLRRIRKDRDDPLSRFAFFAELSFYGFWGGALLLSHAYSVNLYLLLGLSAALRYLHRYRVQPEA